MTPDLEYIQKAFDRYNALCFRGELPGIRLELSRARTYLGRYEEKRPQVRFLGRRFSLPAAEPQRLIRISSAFDLTPEQQDHILGVEACLWSERVPDEQDLLWKLLPRLAAVSELQWSAPEGRNYEGFLPRLQRMEALYTARGWNWNPAE